MNDTEKKPPQRAQSGPQARRKPSPMNQHRKPQRSPQRATRAFIRTCSRSLSSMRKDLHRTDVQFRAAFRARHGSIETEMQMNNEYALAPEISRSFQGRWRQRRGHRKRRAGSNAPERFQQDHQRGQKFFNRHGLLRSPARWWRRECFKLAQATFTPVPFWLDMTATEITAWIEDINAATAEQKNQKAR